MEIKIKSKIYHQPPQVTLYKPVIKALKDPKIMVFFIFFASRASIKSQAMNNGNITLYASVSAKPPAVLVRKEGCIAKTVAAIKPPTFPTSFLVIKNVGITDKAEIKTGTNWLKTFQKI